MKTCSHPADPGRRAALMTLSACAALASMPASGVATAATPQRRRAAGDATESGPLPPDSVYHLDALITDHEGHTQPWSSHRGQPLLATMFYSGCQAVCPMIVEALRHTEAKLAPAERARLRVLMISFDTAHDTVPVLKRTFVQRQLDPRRWSLARADEKTVRQLAAMLGIQYRLLGNGDYNHSSALLAIDAEGRIVGRTSQLGTADPALVEQVRAMLRGLA